MKFFGLISTLGLALRTDPLNGVVPLLQEFKCLFCEGGTSLVKPIPTAVAFYWPVAVILWVILDGVLQVPQRHIFMMLVTGPPWWPSAGFILGLRHAPLAHPIRNWPIQNTGTAPLDPFILSSKRHKMKWSYGALMIKWLKSKIFKWLSNSKKGNSLHLTF